MNLVEYTDEGNTVVISGSKTVEVMAELVGDLAAHAYGELRHDDDTPTAMLVRQAELSVVCLFMQFALEKPDLSKRLLAHLRQWPAPDDGSLEHIGALVAKVLDMDEEADANGLG